MISVKQKTAPSSERVPSRKVARRRNQQNDSRNQLHPLDLTINLTPPSTCDTHILQLSDNCLSKIFGYLNIKDLWSIARVYQHFADIARYRISPKHKAINLLTLDFVDMQELENFLITFGPHIVSLEVTLPKLYHSMDQFDAEEEPEIQKLIVQYCRSSIRVLKLAYFEIHNVNMWLPLISSLKKLHLHRCRFTDQFIRMLACCDDLEELDWNTSKLDIIWSLQFSLTKLKIFRVNEVDGLTTDTMATFLRSNPQLEELGVTNCRNIGSHIFKSIASDAPLIKNVSFITLHSTQFDEDVSNLWQLNALRTLKIDCKNTSGISRLFEQAITFGTHLEHLDLAFCVWDNELHNAISRMKSLKSLGLLSVSDMEIGQLLELIRELVNLTHLHIVECLGLDAQGLVEIVRVAKRLQQLQFYAHFTQVEITMDVLRQLLTLAIARARPERIPLKIVAIVSESEPKTTFHSDSIFLLRCIQSHHLCKQYLADDFFLFNFFYDYHKKIKANWLDMIRECSN